ncbi:MAG: hypothetical protein EXR37_02155 [Limnohabitans sp.]|nr:hypothetical protein [Limnohabitans sp.]
MRIGDIASGRSGDKGDILDLSLVTADTKSYEFLRRHLTADYVGKLLYPVLKSSVQRYEIPGLNALKFVFPNALPGGVYASMHAGLHWQKAAIWLLLDHELPADQVCGR